MTEIAALAAAATRAGDIADRAEAAGLLVVASLLREVAREAEEAVLAAAPPVLAGWPHNGEAAP